jgi:succinate dehydrogenase/fumarate reductase flavoprotein subunit
MSTKFATAAQTPTELTCDLLVIGSGAGGLSAAVTAAHLGLKVIVAEKDPQYGGTTAWSGGWMWVPRNPLATEAGIVEEIAAPLSYLRHELGAQFDEARALAFLNAGPQMVEFFRQNTALQFVDGNGIPDFHGNTPNASLGGRSICAAPFDGRRLGARIADLKPPLPETTLWGMGIASGAELRHFLNATRKLASFWHVTKSVMGYARDHLLYRRGMRLVNGNALVAALAASAFEKGVQVRTGSPAKKLIMKHGRVAGAVLGSKGGSLQDGASGEVIVHARCGVVLACGGFPHDTERKKALLPHAPSGTEHYSAASRGNTGDGLRLGEAAGGVVATDLVQAAALAPVSLVPQKDGSFTHFPHLIERAKPGLIAVTAQGERFCNEADSYHDFMQGLIHATPLGQPVQAWLVCDHAFIRRYGLGAVKPRPMPLGAMLSNGYLRRGNSLAELAQACGINTRGLEKAVQRYNTMAQSGLDADFSKGQTPYNRIQGDAALTQSTGLDNPCMAPLKRGPFYAVRIVPGSLGTFAGLRSNANAQVLDAEDQPIGGLYAGGNDMNSLMGGNYPAGGITLGPAMTFGFISAHHAAGLGLTPEAV